MENEVLITAIFVGAGLLAYVVIPGLLVMWDRVLGHMGRTGKSGVLSKPYHAGCGGDNSLLPCHYFLVDPMFYFIRIAAPV